MTLANRIKSAREAAGITEPADLAKRIGKKPAAAYQWENGATKTLKGLTLLDLSDVLKVNPRWLLTGKGERESQPVRLTPEMISCTQEVLSLYLRFANLPPTLGRDPILLCATFSLVLGRKESVKDLDRTELAIELANAVGLSGGGANANEQGGSR